ncbi:AEC family transporter [Rhodobacterales bacterium HKCCE3408]|nr:AEC family transporter [Rhodobacterales bacterium HKCCE3408]
MIEIFLKTLPFFALIGLGYGAGRTGFFSPEASAYLTKFVFYFALSAMIFGFAANLSLGEILDWTFVGAYLSGCIAVYLLAMMVAFARRRPLAEAAFEAQCAVIGNVGFLGIPMLVVLIGPAAAGPTLLVLSVDLIVFSSLVVILLTLGRGTGGPRDALVQAVLAVVKNPMIVSLALGLLVAGFDVPIPAPVNEFLSILGAAATPGALFAIGASLATKTAERLSVAAWLTFCKLVLHPGAVAIAALMVFDVDPFAAAVMVSAAALPVAGNVYILAQHYGVAPQRVSASILISTAVSIVTVSLVIAWVSGLAGLG